MRILPFLFGALALCAACKNRTGNVPAETESTMMKPQKTDQPPPAFMDFYQKFHTDSLYQMAHITWPLKGQTDQKVDSLRTVKLLIEWQPETWHMQHTVDFSTSPDFIREFELVGDALIIERIRYRAADYGQERRFFQNENGEWELIYYADMQEIKK